MPVLKKGLERAIVWKIAEAVICYGIVSNIYFGTLPYKGGTDLVACLVAEIEETLSDQ